MVKSRLFKIERFHIFAASFARALVADPKKVVEALAKTSLSGGTGRRARLKIVYRKVCRFDSGLRYSHYKGFLEKPDAARVRFFVLDHFSPKMRSASS
jgi:hypothetical protein